MALSRLEEVKNQMAKYVHTVTEDTNLVSPAPAFCLIRDAFVGDIYKIYVNSADPELENFLYMHECGHIIFNHIDNFDKKSLALSSRIRAAFDKYKDWFDNEDSFFNYFKQTIFNVVEDFEVNSKLFTKKEFDESCKLGAEVLGLPEFRGMWPEDYKYPIGKTWREYLTYVLDNLEPFLEKMKNDMNNDDNGNQENQDGNGNGNGNGMQQPSRNGKSKSSQKGAGKNKNNNKQRRSKGFSPEEIEKLKKDIDNRKNSVLEKVANKIEEKIQNQKLGESNDDSDYGDGHSITESIREEYYTFDELKKFFDKNVFNKKNIMTKRDQMYNVNRRKTGNSNLIVPRNLTREEFRADDFYVLLDVSGSVSKELIDNTINLFSDFASKFGRNSRLICWDTSLCFDKKFVDIKNYTIYGDGTNIGLGIDYVAKKYINKKRNKLFIISDFCDDLACWKRFIKSNNLNDVYGVCWEPGVLENNRDIEKCFNQIFKLKVN